MKIFTLFFILLYNSCQIKNVHTNNLTNGQQTDQVQGSWSKCKSTFTEVVNLPDGSHTIEHSIMSNVCQTINLHENGNGELLMGDSLMFKYKWRIEKDLMKFSFDSPEDQSHFLSGELEYVFRLYDKDELLYLEIKPINKEITYFLARAKNGK